MTWLIRILVVLALALAVCAVVNQAEAASIVDHTLTVRAHRTVTWHGRAVIGDPSVVLTVAGRSPRNSAWRMSTDQCTGTVRLAGLVITVSFCRKGLEALAWVRARSIASRTVRLRVRIGGQLIGLIPRGAGSPLAAS